MTKLFFVKLSGNNLNLCLVNSLTAVKCTCALWLKDNVVIPGFVIEYFFLAFFW